MKPPLEELRPTTKPTRTEQARRVVKYIDDLLEFLRKLREKMH